MIIYEEVFKALNKEKIGYLIVGGIAVNLLGLSRATADLDILIDISRDNIIKIDRILQSLGYRMKHPLKAKDLDKNVLVMLSKTKNLKALNYYKLDGINEVDIIVDSPISFAQAIKRAKKITVNGIILPVVSIDDLITMKKKIARAVDKFDVEQLKKLKKLSKSI
jgi:predicted nucleotidyltransferase